MNITSAAGFISMLDEENHILKKFALDKLNEVVNVFWPEISDALDKIEVLYENRGFTNRKLAALVASKVYFHLGSYDDSITFALGAGDLFNVNNQSEYVKTIISKCIDQYTKLRVHNWNADARTDLPDSQKKPIDPRLESIVNLMFQRCFDDRQYKQAIGIALETRRIDIFENAIKKSDNIPVTLSYCLRGCLTLIQNRRFRNIILRVITKIYMQLDNPDYITVCQCYIFLDDIKGVADILARLLGGPPQSVLMAYQIGFDLYEGASRGFLANLQAALNLTLPNARDEDTVTSPDADDSAMETDDNRVAKKAKKENMSDTDKLYHDHMTKLKTIIGGDVTVDLHLQFLIRLNKTDMLILKNTKEAVRNSICHTATVIANSFMHCGTTSTQFLSSNLDWLSRATNWSKFTATASLGVIHKGHEKEALKVLSTYLPKDNTAASAYSDGGSLYALGLIHANHGADITEYILSQLKEATSEMVRHGGCLGLGLAAMGTGTASSAEVYAELKRQLYQDDAVTGEAAGLAMGLVMIGTKDRDVIEDMISYAKETQHEKIQRGLAVGLAMTMYDRQEEADGWVETLIRDKDPILRWAGMYTLGLAYVGSDNNEAIHRLLKIAASDANDDVRRIAVTSIGFILFRSPENALSVISLLSESYNPYVRFGAAMALGISCAGSGLKEALVLLEPLINDRISYVRQGALIASSFILVQHNDSTCAKTGHFRQLYAKVIQDKHEDIMVKFGAIIAQGIIDAGGRNTSISLQTRNGHTNMEAVVGLFVFCQYWHWFPLSLFISMAFQPTAIIGLNAQLKMPVVHFRSNAKATLYSYPPVLEEKKDKTKEKVETAVLSITEKRKKKDAEKRKAEKMEVDEDKIKETDKETKVEVPKETPKEGVVDDGAEKESDIQMREVPEAEPTFQMLENPARVMRPQLRVLSIGTDCKYTPVKELRFGGIIMLSNSQPGEKEELVEPVVAGGTATDEEEPPPPEPFEYVEEDPVADVPMQETVEGAK